MSVKLLCDVSLHLYVSVKSTGAGNIAHYPLFKSRQNFPHCYTALRNLDEIVLEEM